MNHKVLLPFLLVLVTPLFFAYRMPVGEGNESSFRPGHGTFAPAANEKFVIDKKESVVKWKCAMVIADKGGHYGFVSISNGELTTEKNQLVGGAVEIDMVTIADELHNSNNNLIEHLQSSDFFDVKKYPTSKFVITEVTKAEDGTTNLAGDLTIKDITHKVTFPVKMDVSRGVVTATGKMTIDRTKWDVRYGSGKFFDDLADRAISDDIEFDLKIVAKK